MESGLIPHFSKRCKLDLKKKTHKGCKLSIPIFEVIAPAINGNAMPPELNPAIQPIEPVRIRRGRIHEAQFMAIGNMGPKRIPMKEISMALPIREGVNHIVISKLFDSKESSVHIGKN